MCPAGTGAGYVYNFSHIWLSLSGGIKGMKPIEITAALEA